MNQHRASLSTIVCTSLALMLPLSARSAPRSDDPCKQLHRDLDRQIDDVKAQQEDERDQCEDTYGKNSSECRSLADQQKQQLQSLRDSRKQRVSGCTGNTFSDLFLASDDFAFFEIFADQNNYYNSYYDSDYDSKHHHHHHHHPPHHTPPPTPRPGGGGAGTLASGKTIQGSRQVVSQKPGTDTSTAKNSGGAGPSSPPNHVHGSGSPSGSGARTADSGSSSHSGSSHSGSSSSGSSGAATHSSGGGASYSGSSFSGASHSGSSSSGSSSPSPAQSSGSSAHSSGAGTPK